MYTVTTAPTWTTNDLIQTHTVVDGIDMWVTETPSKDFASLVIRVDGDTITHTGTIDRIRAKAEKATGHTRDLTALALL